MPETRKKENGKKKSHQGKSFRQNTLDGGGGQHLHNLEKEVVGSLRGSAGQPGDVMFSSKKNSKGLYEKESKIKKNKD